MKVKLKNSFRMAFNDLLSTVIKSFVNLAHSS